MRATLRGLVVLALVVWVGLAGRVSAQAPGWQNVVSPSGYQLTVPASFAAYSAPTSDFDMFFSPDASQNIGVLILGTPDTDPELDRATDQLLWDGVLNAALTYTTCGKTAHVTSSLQQSSVPGAEESQSGEVSGNGQDCYVLVAFRSGVGYTMSVALPAAYDGASPFVAQTILNSFALTPWGSSAVWPSLFVAPGMTSPASASVEPTPVVTAPTAISFGDGTYIAGTDIQPSTYRAPGGSGCYWARLSGFDGAPDDILANGVDQTSPVVAISSSDAGFQTSGCGNWTSAVPINR